MNDAPTNQSFESDRAVVDWPAVVDDVARCIIIVRGRRVMLDVDLARVYSVPPKRLNEQVKRNRNRFPDDFILRLTLEEARGAVDIKVAFRRSDAGAMSDDTGDP